MADFTVVPVYDGLSRFDFPQETDGGTDGGEVA
jgi:hypothetical protein